MKKTSERIQKILTEDEAIEHHFNLKNQELYATTKRLIAVKGRNIRDFDYAHISSIAYSSKRYRWLIILGILIAIAGRFLSMPIDDAYIDFSLPSIIVGIILVIIGIIKKSERLEVNVVGVPESEKYKGSKEDLDSLLRIVREKQKGGKST